MWTAHASRKLSSNQYKIMVNRVVVIVCLHMSVSRLQIWLLLTLALTSRPSNFSFGVLRSSSSSISTPFSRNISTPSLKVSIKLGSRNLNGSLGYCLNTVATSSAYLNTTVLAVIDTLQYLLLLIHYNTCCYSTCWHDDTKFDNIIITIISRWIIYVIDYNCEYNVK